VVDAAGIRHLVRPQTHQLLENLHDGPAVVLSRYLDILAWNQARYGGLQGLRDRSPQRTQLPADALP
jgi:hypothetical protein